MTVDAKAGRRHCLANCANGMGHISWEGPTIGVAEHEALRPGLLCGAQHPEGELLVASKPVKEVLGVEEDSLVVGRQEPDGVLDHGNGLVEAGLECFGDVAIPGLGHDADDVSVRLDERTERLILLGVRSSPAR